MLNKKSIQAKLITGGSWALTGKVFTSLAALAVNALLARILSPKELGVYFLTFSLASIAALVSQLGFTQTIVRLIAESLANNHPERARASIVIALRNVLIAGMITVLIIGVGGQWFFFHTFNIKLIDKVVWLVAIWALIIACQRVLAEIHRGFHNIKLASLFSGMITSSISVSIFFIIWYTQTASSIYQAILISSMAGLSSLFISIIFVCRKTLSISNSDYESISNNYIFSISWPLWGTSLLYFILTQADVWIVGIFCSPEDVAIYGASVRIVSLVSMPLIILNAVVPPLIVEMYTTGKIQKLEAILRKVTFIAALPAILLVIVFMSFGDVLLSYIYDDYYKAGYLILIILSIAQLVNVAAGSCGQVLMLTGHQLDMMKITILCGLITIGLALALVGFIGKEGVAISAALGMIILNLTMLFTANKKSHIWTHTCFPIKSFSILKDRRHA